MKNLGRRDLGSLYLGRAIRKWRLMAGMSQEELAQRAGVSTTLVGTVERERGHISPEIVCRLSIGLDTTGQSMLAAVLQDVFATMWAEHIALEGEIRERLGRPCAMDEPGLRFEREVSETMECALAALKELGHSWHRMLLSRSGMDRFCPAGSVLPSPGSTEPGKVRARVRRRNREAGERLGDVRVTRRRPERQ